MTTDRIADFEALLTEAEGAHGVFERTELGGVYDEAWAAWYAAYVVEHGLGDLVGRPVTVAELEPLLMRAFSEFKALDPRPTASWAAWVAGRAAAELGVQE